jgi:sortase A
MWNAKKIAGQRYLKYAARVLMVVGFGLLLFCAAAKIHERLLTHVAMRQFENLKQPAVAGLNDNPLPPLALSKPDFLLWSKQRVQYYEEALTRQFAAPSAVLRIKRIHVEAPVLEGTDDLTLNRGVGHIEGTAEIGEKGNVGIAGHRDSFFRGLKDIKVGDEIDLEEPNRTETYVVTKLEIVDPHDVSVLRSTPTPALTLVTCYPFYYIGSAPQRYIVHATLLTTAERREHTDVDREASPEHDRS